MQSAIQAVEAILPYTRNICPCQPGYTLVGVTRTFDTSANEENVHAGIIWQTTAV